MLGIALAFYAAAFQTKSVSKDSETLAGFVILMSLRKHHAVSFKFWNIFMSAHLLLSFAGSLYPMVVPLHARRTGSRALP